MASEEHRDEVTPDEDPDRTAINLDTTQVRQELPNVNCGEWNIHNPHPFRVDEKVASATTHEVGQAAWCPGVLKSEHCGNGGEHDGHVWKDYTDLDNIKHYWCEGVGSPPVTTQQFWFQRNCGVLVVHDEHDWKDTDGSDFHCIGITPQAASQYSLNDKLSSVTANGHRLPAGEMRSCGSNDVHTPHLLADMSRCVGVKPDGTGLYVSVATGGAGITYLIPWPRHPEAFYKGVLDNLGWPHHYEGARATNWGCTAILNINGQSVECRARVDEPFHIKEDTGIEHTSRLPDLRERTPTGHQLPSGEGEATTALTGLLRVTGAIGQTQHAVVAPQINDRRTDDNGLEWIWDGTGWYAANPVQPAVEAVPDLKDLDVPKTPGEPIFGINDASGRSLVEFRIRDGKLDAKYYHEDLYPAARMFVEYLKLLGVEDDASLAD